MAPPPAGHTGLGPPAGWAPGSAPEWATGLGKRFPSRRLRAKSPWSGGCFPEKPPLCRRCADRRTRRFPPRRSPPSAPPIGPHGCVAAGDDRFDRSAFDFYRSFLLIPFPSACASYPADLPIISKAPTVLWGINRFLRFPYPFLAIRPDPARRKRAPTPSSYFTHNFPGMQPPLPGRQSFPAEPLKTPLPLRCFWEKPRISTDRPSTGADRFPSRRICDIL